MEQQQQQQQQAQPLPQHSDNVDEELRRVQLALQAVFSPIPWQQQQQQQQQESHYQTTQEVEQFGQRQFADRYLTSFQNQSIAWLVCDRILLADVTTPPVELSLQQQRWFFAAQTIHKKCCNDIFELPEASLPSLRDSLLNHLQRYSALQVTAPSGNNTTTTTTTTNDALVNRLAMCVAALAVQMGWITIITDLLGSNTESTFDTVTMSILRALPEECASDRLLLRDDSTRYQMRDHLVSSSELVLAYLQAKVQSNASNDSTTIETVLKVFFIWIRYVPIRAAVLVASPLLVSSIHVLKGTASNNNNNNDNARFLELAADVVVEVLHMYPSHHYGNDVLVRVMIPELANLPLDTALRSHDEDIILIYTRIVTEMGESYMSLLLSNDYRLFSQLVDWVLRCSEITVPEISAITFHFWYRMVTDLECTEPYEWRQELIDYYTPYLLKLVYICASNLMKYPTDIDDSDGGDDDDRMDDIKNHRLYVAETIDDCCRLLGGTLVLEEFGKYLRDEVTRTSQNNQQLLATTTDWFGIESGLACIAALHKFVSSDDTTIIPYIMSLVPHLPSNVPLLRYTTNQIIGQYAFWLSKHPESIQPLLLYVSESLRIKTCHVASAAATSIRELCERSNPTSFPLSEPVLQLYEEFASQTGNLDLPDEIQILQGVCSSLSRTIMDTRPNDDGRTFLVRLAQPIGSRLTVACQTDISSSPNHTIIPEIDRLTAIVTYLKLPASSGAGSNISSFHPIVELIQSLWSIFETVTSRFPRDPTLAEKICRFHKYSLRACGPVAYSPMLNPLLQQLVQSFNVTRQSPYLYAASICITEYRQDPTVSQRFYEMIQAMATTAFSFLRTFDEITNHPDVIEEFFYLLGRMFDHHPEILATSPLLLSLLESAIVAMQLDHQGAQKGTLKFLESTLHYGTRLRDQATQPECQVALQSAYSKHGPAIILQLVRILVGDLPSYSNQSSDLIYKFSQLLPSQLSEWVKAAFQSTSLSEVIPDRATGEFVAAIDMRLARDEFDLVMNAFRQACDRERRMRRMTSISQQ